MFIFSLLIWKSGGHLADNDLAMGWLALSAFTIPDVHIRVRSALLSCLGLINMTKGSHDPLVFT